MRVMIPEVSHPRVSVGRIHWFPTNCWLPEDQNAFPIVTFEFEEFQPVNTTCRHGMKVSLDW